MKFANHNVSEPFRPESEEEDQVTVSVQVDGSTHLAQVPASEAPNHKAVSDGKHKDHKKAKTTVEELIVKAHDLKE